MSSREVQKVLNEFGRTGKDLQSEQATRWLARNLSKIQSEMRSGRFITNRTAIKPGKVNPGSMVFFGYDPKTKNELPFWDSFPLVIILHRTSKSFLGLNLHYLQPTVRANFLNELLKLTDNPNYVKNPPAYFLATYPMVKMLPRLKPFKAAIKRYYTNHIVTSITPISSEEWKYTTFMPLDKFKGATREEVWKWANRYSK